LYFDGTQTVGGAGEIALSAVTYIYLSQSGMTLTLGPNLTVHGGDGVFAARPTGNEVNNDRTVVNQGTIAADAARRSGGIAVYTNLVNAPGGRIQLTAAGSQFSTGLSPGTANFVNQGEITVTAGLLDTNVATFANSGTVNLSGGTLSLSSTWS